MNKDIQLAIQKKQSSLFVQAYDSGYDIVFFIKSFMKSALAREIDKEYSSWHMRPASAWLDEIVINSNIHKIYYTRINYNRSAVEWLGYFYRMWHFATNESSSSIIRYLNPIDGIRDYYVLHQLDELNAIEICKTKYNKKRNNHRKYEIKNNQVFFADRLGDNYYPLLVKNILYKLLKNEKIKATKTTNNHNYFDLYNDDFGITICKATNIDLALTTVFRKHENNVAKYKTKPDLLIYFCFLTTNENVSESKLVDYVRKHLYLTNNLIESRIHDYLYFYCNGLLIEINVSNEINTYYIPMSIRGLRSIVAKTKKNL